MTTDAGKFFTITNTERVLDLRAISKQGDVDLEAVEANIFYKAGTGSIRTAPIADTASDYDTGVYTVTDASIYRVGETIEVYNAGGDYVGIVRVVEIDTDTEEVTISTLGETLSLANTDVLHIPADPILMEGKELCINTRSMPIITVKAQSASVVPNLLVAVTSAGIKKKD